MISKSVAMILERLIKFYKFLAKEKTFGLFKRLKQYNLTLFSMKLEQMEQ